VNLLGGKTGVLRKEVLGIKVLSAPGPADHRPREKRARSITSRAPALTLTTPCPTLPSCLRPSFNRH
jgi:hypothetical protein